MREYVDGAQALRRQMNEIMNRHCGMAIGEPYVGRLDDMRCELLCAMQDHLSALASRAAEVGLTPGETPQPPLSMEPSGSPTIVEALRDRNRVGGITPIGSTLLESAAAYIETLEREVVDHRYATAKALKDLIVIQKCANIDRERVRTLEAIVKGHEETIAAIVSGVESHVKEMTATLSGTSVPANSGTETS